MTDKCEHALVLWDEGPSMICLLCRDHFVPESLLREALKALEEVHGHLDEHGYAGDWPMDVAWAAILRINAVLGAEK